MRGQAPALILAEFFKDRLDARTREMVNCTKETFETHKGRCLELQSLISFIEGRDNT